MWAWVPAIASVFLIILWTIVLGVHRLLCLGEATPEVKPKKWLIKWLGDQSQLPSWVNTLLSVLLSVLLATSFAWAMFQAQKETADNNRREDLLRLLRVEAETNKSNFETPYIPTIVIPGIGVIHPKIAFVSTIALDEAIRSGLFDSTKSRYMHVLMIDVQEYSNMRQEIYDCLSGGKADPDVGHILIAFERDLNGKYAKVMDDIGILIDSVVTVD